MPLFGNKFSAKKATPRKSPSLSNLNLDRASQQAEFGRDYGPIQLKLQDKEFMFQDGQWLCDTSEDGSTRKELDKLRKENRYLSEENNLLKLKIDILFDMLAETTCQGYIQQNEIDELQTLLSSRKSRKK